MPKITPPCKVWQWDINDTITVEGIENVSEWQVHFATVGDTTALVIEIHQDMTAYIPNQLVELGTAIYAYLYNVREERAYTETAVLIPVNTRPKPSDYISEPTDVLTWGQLRADIGTLSQLATEDKTSLVAAVNELHGDIDSIETTTTEQEQSITAIQSGIKKIERSITDINSTDTAQSQQIKQNQQDIDKLAQSDTQLAKSVSSLAQTVDKGFKQVQTELDKKQPVGDYITSVNGTTPDEGGNVEIDVQTYTAGDGIDISESGEIAVTNPMDDGVVSPATTWSSARIVGELEKAGVFRKCGILWDKVKATCTRLWDAAGITTDTSNFGHFGTVNPNYDNPFDDIYPWSERRVCNYDMRVLKTIVADGYDVLDAVTAWEGEDAFSYDPAEGLGVGVYTPKFWYTAYDTAEGRVFGVSGAPIKGWYYSEPIIAGRWLGVVEQLDGVSVLGCRVGIPTSSVAIGTLHTYAENASMTIDDVYSWDAETVLQIIEYANMNTQIATGDGVSSLYRENATDLIMEDATDSTVVKVVAANAAYAIPGAIMDIGTSKGGMQVGRRYVISTAADETDETLLCVTLDEPVTVTTANFWSIHGLINVADAEIGSASGYIGTNGRCNAYYRGRATAGNKFQYCLGAHREGQINKIWIVPTRYQAETVLSLDTSVCIDTGCTLPWAEGNAAIGGYIGELALADGIAAFPLCSALGGSSSKPVGDYAYIPAKGRNTVSVLGGHASSGSGVGRFYAYWSYLRVSSSWSLAASPSTKTALRS